MGSRAFNNVVVLRPGSSHPLSRHYAITGRDCVYKYGHCRRSVFVAESLGNTFGRICWRFSNPRRSAFNVQRLALRLNQVSTQSKYSAMLPMDVFLFGPLWFQYVM